jgi:hypothetical protein
MLISPDDVETLRPEEKDAILDAMLGMAWSDGEIHADEVDLLATVTGFFTEKDVNELIKEYKPDIERVGRKIASSDLGPAGKKVMLRAMAYIAAADEDLDEKELSFYRGCLRAFGVAEPVREKIEKQVRREVYTAMLRRKLFGRELDDAARDELAKLKKRLEIGDAEATEIEQQVQKSLAKAKKA